MTTPLDEAVANLNLSMSVGDSEHFNSDFDSQPSRPKIKNYSDGLPQNRYRTEASINGLMKTDLTISHDALPQDYNRCVPIYHPNLQGRKSILENCSIGVGASVPRLDQSLSQDGAKLEREGQIEIEGESKIFLQDQQNLISTAEDQGSTRSTNTFNTESQAPKDQDFTKEIENFIDLCLNRHESGEKQTRDHHVQVEEEKNDIGVTGFGPYSPFPWKPSDSLLEIFQPYFEGLHQMKVDMFKNKNGFILGDLFAFKGKEENTINTEPNKHGEIEKHRAKQGDHFEKHIMEDEMESDDEFKEMEIEKEGSEQKREESSRLISNPETQGFPNSTKAFLSEAQDQIYEAETRFSGGNQSDKPQIKVENETKNQKVISIKSQGKTAAETWVGVMKRHSGIKRTHFEIEEFSKITNARPKRLGTEPEIREHYVDDNSLFPSAEKHFKTETKRYEGNEKVTSQNLLEGQSTPETKASLASFSTSDFSPPQNETQPKRKFRVDNEREESKRVETVRTYPNKDQIATESQIANDQAVPEQGENQINCPSLYAVCEIKTENLPVPAFINVCPLNTQISDEIKHFVLLQNQEQDLLCPKIKNRSKPKDWKQCTAMSLAQIFKIKREPEKFKKFEDLFYSKCPKQQFENYLMIREFKALVRLEWKNLGLNEKCIEDHLGHFEQKYHLYGIDQQIIKDYLEFKDSQILKNLCKKHGFSTDFFDNYLEYKVFSKLFRPECQKLNINPESIEDYLVSKIIGAEDEKTKKDPVKTKDKDQSVSQIIGAKDKKKKNYPVKIKNKDHLEELLHSDQPGREGVHLAFRVHFKAGFYERLLKKACQSQDRFNLYIENKQEIYREFLTPTMKMKKSKKETDLRNK